MDKNCFLRWLLAICLFLNFASTCNVKVTEGLLSDSNMDLENNRNGEFPLEMDRNFQKLAELAFKRRQDIKKKVVSSIIVSIIYL